ncbi:MAG TPA: hypothetical protein ENN40_03320 [Candidatus Aminicenantes bacterium]|nr:hypothetical protein [Candidatus Aminicenantes bacterium]
MRTIRIGFVVAVLVLAAGALLWLNQTGETKAVDLPGFSHFQLTRIAPQRGKVYFDKEMTREADLSTLDWPQNFELFADPQTAFEFLCSGAMFVALPGSSIRVGFPYNRLLLRNGDFNWALSSGDDRVEVGAGDKPLSLLLPLRGRLKVSLDEIVLWAYSGEGSLKVDGETISVPEHARFTRFRGTRSRMDDLLPPPQNYKPRRAVIPLREPNDSVVRFTWQRVDGADGYVFRIFPSMLREGILMERFIPGNQLNVELMVFQEYDDFFWDVSAISQQNKMEGVPTPTGHVRLEGSLLGRKSVTRPPQLTITSLTVGGNIVLIKGEAESSSQLFINSAPVKIDMDGKFIHTMTYRTIGLKTIEFRLVSPSETETVVTRQVTIFEEGI